MPDIIANDHGLNNLASSTISISCWFCLGGGGLKDGQPKQGAGMVQATESAI